MMEQYRRVKAENPDALLFFRLGDFYELFYEDAEVAARELDIVLTGRDAGNGERAPMCGVPYRNVEPYVKRLLDRGHRVAIAEQMEDPRFAQGLVDRRVVRVFSAGTILEPGLLDERRPNFIACVAATEGCLALAFAEASTGRFDVTEWHGEERVSGLLAEMDRLEPAEIVIAESQTGGAADQAWLRELEEQNRCLTRERKDSFRLECAEEQLRAHFGVLSLAGYGLEGHPTAIRAAGALLAYLAHAQAGAVAQITSLRFDDPGAYMPLDAATRRNLELTRRTLDDAREGSLLSVLDCCQTAAGSRQLKEWLEHPLNQRLPIERRLAVVAYFVADPILRARCRRALSSVRDLERLATRCVLSLANPREVRAIATSLLAVHSVQELLSQAGATPSVPDQQLPTPDQQLPTPDLLLELRAQMRPLPELAQRIEAALVDEPPLTLEQGPVIKSGWNSGIDRLRLLSGGRQAAVARIEQTERETTGIRSLKVGYNKVFGYYIEVSRAQRQAVPAHYVRRQTLSGAERYVTPELTSLEEEIIRAAERLRSLEAECFQELRDTVGAEISAMQATARVIATLDVLLALAEMAATHGYVRPQLSDQPNLEIVQGRHPVLEERLEPGAFVPNDVLLDERQRILLVTGPNMAGKSTYARQTALIVLMAQIGSWVPADACRLGVADRIFTRIGAADDLAAGKSTTGQASPPLPGA